MRQPAARPPAGPGDVVPVIRYWDEGAGTWVYLPELAPARPVGRRVELEAGPVRYPRRTQYVARGGPSVALPRSL